MSNTTLTIDMITREALRVFNNELKFVKNINRQHDASFAKSGAKIGTSIRIRKPAQVTVGTGATATAQDFQEDYTTLTVGTQNHVLLNFTSSEMTMSLDDFSARVIKPVVTRLANHVDATAMSTVYKSVNNFVGTPGTSPGTITTWMAANQKLNEFCALSDRRAVISPAAEAATVIALSGFYNQQQEIGKQYKTGTMSNALGIDWFMSQNVPTHTCGTVTTATNYTVTDVSTDTSIVKIKANAGSAELKIGDVVEFAGVYALNPVTKQNTGSLAQFVVTANTTVNTTGVNVSVNPPLTTVTTAGRNTVSGLPADGAVTSLKTGSSATSYPQNLIFDPDAFTFATADLELPSGAEGSRQVMDGISMRIVKDYSITSDLNLCRLDVLWGVLAQRPENAVRVTG